MRVAYRSSLRKAILLLCSLAAAGSNSAPAAAYQDAAIAASQEKLLCRGTSADEDAALEGMCTAVCRSTDADCSGKLYSLIRDGDARVKVMGGTYPMKTPYSVANVQDISITGDGSTLFEFDNASIQFINDQNVELGNFHQQGTSDHGAGYFRFNGTQDIYLHNITFDSPAGNSRMFFISDGTRVTIKDSYFKAESTGLCLLDASGRDWVVENNHWENGSNACLNAFGSLCNARFINNHYIGSGTTAPYAAISLEEFADRCGNGIAYDNITIQKNLFKDVDGVMSVDREQGYRYDNITIAENEFHNRTAISFHDEVHGLAVLNNTLSTDVLWHAVNLAPKTAEDGTMTDVTVAGNRIEHTAADQTTMMLARIENATISWNDIKSQADCSLFSRINGAVITGNRLTCGSRAFRFSGSNNVSEYCNEVASPARYSAAGNTNYYFEMWHYTALPAGCSPGGLMDRKTIILNTMGTINQLTCINGTWQAYDSNALRCPSPPGDPAQQ
jgi:hypothetical protein